MAIHSPEYLTKRRRRVRLFLISFTTILLVLVGSTAYVSNMERFRITDSVVVGNVLVGEVEIKGVVNETLSGKYFWLYTRANTALYPRADIRERLFRDIPRLSEVNLRIINSQTLEVKVKEREPHALYCKNIERISDPENCYFLDSNGFIYSVAPTFSGDVYFLYSSYTPLTEPVASAYLAPTEFRAVSNFIVGLTSLGVELRAFEIGPEGEEHHLILEQGGRIIWNSSESIEKVAVDLEAFLFSESIAGQSDFFEKISEIDLRYANKVFYRFKD